MRTLRKITKRNRSGTFKGIITEINQVTRGWINYFDEIGYIPFSKEQAYLFYQLMSIRYEIHNNNNEHPLF
ncbi:group II intron maturase-specific domain-containing protein [Staphylococcus cornubiensis]|uniref:group II intron maturase-specific domain-containing protein n=1 Tax=Staphylococcus cornubiensis TaxID=1986155 RepID=UPI003B82CBD1